MEDQTNPVFPVGGEPGKTDPLMADALDGAMTDGSEAEDEESADGAVTAPVDNVSDDISPSGEEDDDTIGTGLDGGSGDPNDDRAFLMDQAPADLSGATSDGADAADSAVIAGATTGRDAEVADGSGPDEDDAEAWGVDAAGSERAETDRDAGAWSADAAGSEREEADRADAAEALGLGVEDGDDPLDDGALR
ncbi:hypothetical protein [Microbacterium sp. ZW T5_56]|uniref:hypothetical protein n=1 Tax=Microbacterium sp. ZW T5_56 TaxID=3378081 RepID=UPI00385500BE